MIGNLGWNTWDVNHVNGLVHLESGLRIRFILFEPSSGERKESFGWKNDLAHLGPHSGRELHYAQIGLRWKGSEFVFTYAVENDRLVCQISAHPVEGLQLIVEADCAWDTRVRLEKIPAGLRAFTGGGEPWLFSAAQGEIKITDGENERGRMVFDLGLPVLLDVRKERAPAGGPPAEVIDEQREHYESQRLRSGGWLMGCVEGLTRSIHWNTIWEPVKGRICTPVSREWCTNPAWGGYVLFDWDTFFCALMASLESSDLMQDNIIAILTEITQQGFVPNFGSANGASEDRSQPPVGAYVVLKAWRGLRLADISPHREMLEETFDRLLGWHRWWFPHRDGNQDGLLEWGSDALEKPHAWENHTLRAAMYESGLDNSPMYDEAKFSQSSSTMELADVGLNALYALDAWALSEIAGEIGRDAEARSLHAEYVELAGRINGLLWNEEAGIYQNRYWDGRFSSSLSPTLFYPLVAGIVPPERASRMVREHLLNEKEFWGEYVIPSISRSDPGYRKGEIVREGVSESTPDYWRGRIWGPMNFLVAEGLRRYELDREAHEFARKSANLFQKEWNEKNHVHENYNDLTGEGDDAPSSNALYHWGALLAYLGIQELADCEAWDGWRFGCLDEEQAEISGIQVEEGRLNVSSGAQGLRVEIDGRVLLQSDRAVIVRGYRIEPGRIEFRLDGEVEEVQLRIGLFKKGSVRNDARVKLRVGRVFELGSVQTLALETDGSVNARLSVPCEVEVTW